MPGRVKGMYTWLFIKNEDIPQEQYRDVTYGKFVVDYQEKKEEKKE